MLFENAPHGFASSSAGREGVTGLQALAEPGVYGIPFFEVTLDDLVAFAEEPGYCASALSDVRAQLQLDDAAALCIKPARDGGSTGVMRLEEPVQFALYARAIVEEWPYIPAELVPGAQSARAMSAALCCSGAALRWAWHVQALLGPLRCRTSRPSFSASSPSSPRTACRWSRALMARRKSP